MQKQYCNYHRHSHYTNVRICDSIATNQDYAKRALETGDQIISSVEHGWQGFYIETYNLAKANNLKCLIGAEAYWVKDRSDPDGTNCHMCLLAKNENGRQALNDILSEANLSGFYRQPRVDPDLLKQLPPDDVWITTACIAGWRYGYEYMDSLIEEMHDYFGNNLLLEVQYHKTEPQIELNQHILQLRDKLHMPIIMGCDSHYIYQNDDWLRTAFLESKGITYPDEEGWYLDYPTAEQAYRRFAEQAVLTDSEIEEAMSNTLIFSDVEEYDSPIFNSELKLPTIYPELSQEEKDQKYVDLVWQGWEQYKYEVPEDQWAHYEDEIKAEMQVVIDTHMADYFIIDYYTMKRGKELGGLLTHSARGSSPSFFSNMLLGFSEVDRIAAPVHMYPSRFMSTERILQSGSLPDID